MARGKMTIPRALREFADAANQLADVIDESGIPLVVHAPDPQRIGNVSERSGKLLELLEKHGPVPFVKLAEFSRRVGYEDSRALNGFHGSIEEIADDEWAITERGLDRLRAYQRRVAAA